MRYCRSTGRRQPPAAKSRFNKKKPSEPCVAYKFIPNNREHDKPWTILSAISEFVSSKLQKKVSWNSKFGDDHSSTGMPRIATVFEDLAFRNGTGTGNVADWGPTKRMTRIGHSHARVDMSWMRRCLRHRNFRSLKMCASARI